MFAGFFFFNVSWDGFAISVCSFFFLGPMSFMVVISRCECGVT